MIYEKTQGIMLKGIERYAGEYGVEPKDVQIHVMADSGDGVLYKMCQGWRPKEEVTFLQIMGKKMDLLGFEMLSTPFMRKSLDKFANEFDTDVKNVSVFLANHQGSVALAVYSSTQCVKTLTLKQHFEDMGM